MSGVVDGLLVVDKPGDWTSHDVVARARSAVLADWRGAARRRLPELLGSVRERGERHGELAYLVEPDLKEARGGLRDVVVLRALAATWLADRPHGELDDAAAFLLDVRDAVAVVTGVVMHAWLLSGGRRRDGSDAGDNEG